MKHLGDITKIDGWSIPIVDIVTGGSPCQDLSIAGKRAGLDGERSGLFMEQIRIVKEMRANDICTNDHRGVAVRPRYMVWENVPGALSSGTPKGEDFRIVLEEICKIKDPEFSVPRCEKWAYSGCIMGEDFSIAWRITDNQFWGTPQRRRRIALVADFGGQCAPEILFECKSVSGNTQSSGEERKGTSGNFERSVNDSSVLFYSKQRSDEMKQSDVASTQAARQFKDSTDLIVDKQSFGIASFANYTPGVSTLRSQGGDIGGGSETLIVQ